MGRLPSFAAPAVSAMAEKARAMEGGPCRLGDFKGRWRLVRVIEDRRADAIGTLEGEAVFSVRGGGLFYRETGTLVYAGLTPVMAERRYLWRQEGGDIVVDYETGASFHRFALRHRTPGAVHRCAADLYRAAYDFTDWPGWRAIWTVSGPRKEYRMVSRYSFRGERDGDDPCARRDKRAQDTPGGRIGTGKPRWRSS
ncbi:MAG: DUF6314 family protein [Pseudomonadota bacterium]